MIETNNQSMRSNDIADLSRNVRERTIKRIDAVPNEFINWRLNNTALSFAHIVQHLINVDNLFIEMMQANSKQFKWKMGTEEPHNVVDLNTYGTMITSLKSIQNIREQIIRSLSNSDLNQEVIDESGKKMTLWWFIMDNLIAHEVYHRGQISAYLKVLKGEHY